MAELFQLYALDHYLLNVKGCSNSVSCLYPLKRIPAVCVGYKKVLTTEAEICFRCQYPSTEIEERRDQCFTLHARD